MGGKVNQKLTNVNFFVLFLNEGFPNPSGIGLIWVKNNHYSSWPLHYTR